MKMRGISSQVSAMGIMPLFLNYCWVKTQDIALLTLGLEMEGWSRLLRPAMSHGRTFTWLSLSDLLVWRRRPKLGKVCLQYSGKSETCPKIDFLMNNSWPNV